MKGFLNQKVLLSCDFLWVSLSNVLLTLFRFLLRVFLSSLPKEHNQKVEPEIEEYSKCEANGANYGRSECLSAHQSNGNEEVDSNSSHSEEGVEPEVEDSDIINDTLNDVSSETEERSKLFFKFQFQSWKMFEESDTEKSDSLDKMAISDSGFLLRRDFMQQNFETEPVKAEVPEELEAMAEAEKTLLEREHVETFNNNIPEEKFSEDGISFSQHDFNGLGADSDTIDPNPKTPISSHSIGSTSDSVKDFKQEGLVLNDVKLENLSVRYEPRDFSGRNEGEVCELRKIEEECQVENQDISNPEKSVKPNELNSKEKCSKDSNGIESLWEDEDIRELLKMELKKVKSTGLPTILEESEPPNMMEDLKPLKIDEKFMHGGPTNELPMFYKSYRERMRKFDMLNYQKMYALGLLPSKDHLQLFSSRKSFAQPITSLLSHGFRLCRGKRIESDPMKKNFIRELYSDLEMVYVGQLCLSWEFLHWQYEKALELWEKHPCGLSHCNGIAGEFQQFQVLLQRFIENEPFQGPRVDNYVKKRYLMPNLLQVPPIIEEKSRDRKKTRREQDDDVNVTSELLVEMLEESIGTIWRFIRADKDSRMKSQRKTHLQLRDPSDSELLAYVRADLQKKEKTLKEILRSEKCCILKRFHKHQEDGCDHSPYFFSQVDMKLVWRVLNMSRITRDQLTWCCNKLKSISLSNRRRVPAESSLVVFPC